MCYTAAYGAGTPLGRDNMDLQTLYGVQKETVQQFMAKWYRPARMVVGGLGLDHDRLVDYSIEYRRNFTIGRL